MTFKIATTLLFTTFMVTCGIPAATAQITANPNDAGTIVNQNGNTINIQGGTQIGGNLFHSLNEFRVNQGQTANFISNPATQNIFGRVTGGNASVINGLIQVTGGNSNLYLMNPAGIIFGAGASLNVPAAFTATTANGIGFGDKWFNAVGANNYASLLGNPNGFAFIQAGTIFNAGNLAVGSGQNLTLLGGTVISTGTISAPGGNITIAAIPGEKLVRITPEGSLLSLALPLETKAAINPSALTPLTLPQLLTGGNISGATGVTVENGVVKLTGADVTIPNTPGIAVVSNQVNVSGATGGTVNVLGEKVALVGANINASGTNGGGTVLIGGDYQGKGTVPNASQTFISRDSTINADAVQNGNGGRVIAWADGINRFYGNISARGGVNGGDGGFVEVSGKKNLAFDGLVNVGATVGKGGLLLLDPANVTIAVSDTNNDQQLDDGQINLTDGGTGNFWITPNKVVEALNNGDVSITAKDSIVVNNEIYTIGNSRSSNLTLSAGNIDVNSPFFLNQGSNLILTSTAAPSATGGININGDLTITSGNITFAASATGGININGNLTITNGNITFNSNSPININNSQVNAGKDLTDLTVQGGNITFNGSQSLSINNSQINAGKDLNVQVQKDLTVENSTLSAYGNLTLKTQNNLNLKASEVKAGQNLELQAQGKVSVEDIAGKSAIALAGNDIKITGIQGIDIATLNNPQSVFRSSANLKLISNGVITGNGRFITGENFAVINSDNKPGDFRYTPVNSNGIISATGDISFGDYTGTSLKVEAGGSIKGGDIEITDVKKYLTGTDSDIPILASNPALILRAGLSELSQKPNVLPKETELRNSPNVTSQFNASGSPSAKGTITVGNIKIDKIDGLFTYNGAEALILSAPGGIKTGAIQTGGGAVKLTSSEGNIIVDTINTRFTNSVATSSVDINSKGIFQATGSFGKNDLKFSFPLSVSVTDSTSIVTTAPVRLLDPRELNGHIKIIQGGVSFEENYGTRTLSENVGGTAGKILIFDNGNAKLVDKYQDSINIQSLGTYDNNNTKNNNNNNGGDTLSITEQEAAQRQLTSKANNPACNTSTPVAVTPTGERTATASATDASNSCKPATNDKKILQILDETPNPSQNKELHFDSSHPKFPEFGEIAK